MVEGVGLCKRVAKEVKVVQRELPEVAGQERKLVVCGGEVA